MIVYCKKLNKKSFVFKNSGEYDFDLVNHFFYAARYICAKDIVEALKITNKLNRNADGIDKLYQSFFQYEDSDAASFKGFTHYEVDGSNEILITEEIKNASKNKITNDQITFTINDKKEKCEEIGYKPQTDKFADCVLRLVELDVKSQQQAQIQLALSQGNQQLADELRKQRNQQSGAYLMDLGQKLLNPPTKKTTRCTVTGTGSFKTVTCR